MKPIKIILASGSPRRRQLLKLANIPHEVIVSNTDETIEGEPMYQVLELALRKNKAVQPLVNHEAIIISADTLVYIDGEVLGKPSGADEAYKMLKKLQGKPHTVYTGVALYRTTDGMLDSFTAKADVFFHPLTDKEIHAYIKTGEPFDKAGAYGIQERGAVLVEKVIGDFYTVVGLPISMVCKSLAKMGYDIWE